MSDRERVWLGFRPRQVLRKPELRLPKRAETSLDESRTEVCRSQSVLFRTRRIQKKVGERGVIELKVI
jgi:hypothetical protein